MEKETEAMTGENAQMSEDEEEHYSRFPHDRIRSLAAAMDSMLDMITSLRAGDSDKIDQSQIQALQKWIDAQRKSERLALETRADELIGCTEGSKEEEELKAISDVLDAMENKGAE